MTALERVKDIERVWDGCRDDATDDIQFLLRAFRVMLEIANESIDPFYIDEEFEERMKDFVVGANNQ